MSNETAPETTTPGTNALIESMDISQLREMLQNAGYRSNDSERNGVVQLLSASQGIGFVLRPGNPAQTAEHVLDFTLSCALTVQGELPATLLSEWNSTKRFARLSESNGFLVMEKDVVVAGGVTRRYLQANMELWDRLLQEFALFLRNFAAQNGQVPAPVVAAAEQESVKQAPTEQTEHDETQEQQV